MAENVHFGIKKLALHNWREPDLPAVFPGLTEQDWVADAMKPRLIAEVPEEVVRMFEVARGSILYGWFYYPLLTLASEQLHRVQEAALRERCKLSGIPLVKKTKNSGERRLTFSDLIGEMVRRRVIPSDERVAWEATRRLRNWSSHPQRQTIFPPGVALTNIEKTARQINQLFAPNPVSFTHLGEHVREATRKDGKTESQEVVAGIDVGSPENGFHIVALRGSDVVECSKILDPSEAPRWCLERGVTAVAVDAPSGWCTSSERKCREAEEFLAVLGYSSYPTPHRQDAVGNPNYKWMLNGERLYAALQQEFPLFGGRIPDGRFCFETYPYVASCGLAGRRLRAENKNHDRRDILRAAGIDDRLFRNIDFVDAAICALVVQSVRNDYCIACGNPEEGFILSTPFP